MYYVIKSRRLKHDVTFFWTPGQKTGTGYIYVDMTPNNNKPGVLGDQICDGGGFLGSTLSAYSKDDFINTSKKWWKSFLRNTYIEY